MIRMPVWDVLRGVAFAAALIGHAVLALGYFASSTPEPLRWVVQPAEPVRMQLLMFLSGVFLQQALQKGVARYTWRRLSTVVWPYVLWGLLAWTLTSDLTPDIWWRMFVNPPETHLWFLLFLAWYAVLGPLLRRVPWWVVVPAALIAAAVLPPEARLDRFAYLFAFFFAGHAYAADHRFALLLRHRWTLVVGSAAGVVVLGVSAAGVEVQYEPLGAVGPLGIIAVLVAAATCVRWRWPAPLVWFGRNTIPFYVSHILVIKVVAAGLQHIGFVNPWFMFGTEIVTAVAFGLALAFVRSRYPVSGILLSLAPLERWWTARSSRQERKPAAAIQPDEGSMIR